MKAAKKIQKAKDIREVERDLALIKSPAAGLKKANKEMTEEEMEDNTEVDTSLNLGTKQKVKAREQALEGDVGILNLTLSKVWT